MNIQQILAINLKLIKNKIINHSMIEALCNKLLFDQKSDSTAQASFLQDFFNRSQWKNKTFLDWFNIMLFNVCAFNQDLMVHCDNQMLQSTEDVNKFSVKELKQYLTTSGSSKIKVKLKIWLTKLLSMPSIEKIYSQITVQQLQKNKSLRSLLETIDYICLKYEISLKNSQRVKQMIRNSTRIVVSQKSQMISEKIFNQGPRLYEFLEQINTNYLINIQQLSNIISSNYLEAKTPRKIFQKSNVNGKIVTQQIVDYTIRKINKVELFSQKNEQYKPFQILMGIILTRQSSILIHIYSLFDSIEKRGSKSIWDQQNQKEIQGLAHILAFQIPNNYPYFHKILKYIFSSLIAKYSQSDSIELMKKFILNRFFFNPQIFTVLNPVQKEESIAKFVRIANNFRILFYEKKASQLSQNENNPKIIQYGNLLRSFLQKMLRQKEVRVVNEIFINDKGIYINDYLLNNSLGQLSENLRLESKKNTINQSNNSQISLSFQLKNESFSKINVNPHHNISSNQSFVPHIPVMPKPVSKSSLNNNKSQKALKELPQIINKSDNHRFSQDQDVFPADKLQSLVSQRRIYGQLKRQIESRCSNHSKKRQNWIRSLLLLNEPLVELRRDLQKSSNQINSNTLIF